MATATQNRAKASTVTLLDGSKTSRVVRDIVDTNDGYVEGYIKMHGEEILVRRKKRSRFWNQF